MLKISLLLTLAAASGPAAPRTASVAATPVPQATAIKLDGAFNESAWDGVPAINDFKQREPKDGGAPTFATDVRVVYAASNLYVAVRAHDPEPEKLIGLRTRRDPSSPPTWIRGLSVCFPD